MPRGVSVLGIANELLLRGFGAGEPLTHMQLQKLCYMAHGFTLALLDEPLTFNEIEAWDLGPVYPTLYDALKSYGNEPITALICQNNWAILPHIRGDIVKTNLDETKEEILQTVWRDYSEFDAFELSALTHEKGTPWSEVYVPDKKHIRISDDRIKDYFIGLTSGN